MRVETTTVNISSLYSRIKSEYSTSKKYKKFFSKHSYNEYLSQVFTFSKSAKKKTLTVKKENVPNTNDNLSEEKSKKIIAHYETVIVKLREELSQQRQLLQQYHCKTRSQENTIVSLRKGVKAKKQENTSNDKFKAKIEDKGVQCNTMRSLITDLIDEIESLQLEIDSTEEYNNYNIDVSDKVFNTQPSGQGTAFSHKIRQVYYTLRSIGISLSTFDFVIGSVVSMVDIDIDYLPSK